MWLNSASILLLKEETGIFPKSSQQQGLMNIISLQEQWPYRADGKFVSEILKGHSGCSLNLINITSFCS